MCVCVCVCVCVRVCACVSTDRQCGALGGCFERLSTIGSKRVSFISECMSWVFRGARRCDSRCAFALFLSLRFWFGGSTSCSRNPPGGNQVDGLPPAAYNAILMYESKLIFLYN